jgi:ubiquitin-conjugating enzyme E2 Z
MSIVISKETIHRLLKDVKQIIKNPLTENGIYYIHDDEDMLKGYALIVGPDETPYFAGNYFFELNYPADYPHSPPIVKYYTNGNDIRFNPNLYKCGKVCISLLNTWRGEQWTSCQTISTVLLTLCTLLCKEPLLNEPCVSKNHIDFNNYTDIIEYANINIAICDILMRKKGVCIPFFDLFDLFIKENFLKNVEKVTKFVENKSMIGKFSKLKVVKTGIYSMVVEIDYPTLLAKLKSCSDLLSSNNSNNNYENHHIV